MAVGFGVTVGVPSVLCEELPRNPANFDEEHALNVKGATRTIAAADCIRVIRRISPPSYIQYGLWELEWDRRRSHLFADPETARIAFVQLLKHKDVSKRDVAVTKR